MDGQMWRAQNLIGHRRREGERIKAFMRTDSAKKTKEGEIKKTEGRRKRERERE